MKHLYKLALLAGASLGLIGITHAEGRLVEFTQIAQVQDIACVLPEKVTEQKVPALQRTAQYQITNFGPTSVNLVFELENYDRFLDSMFRFEKIDCATIESESFATGSLASGASCDITLFITPPDCPVMDPDYPIYGPASGPIDRVLEIDINTRQIKLEKYIAAQVTTLGAAAAFGVLSGDTINNSTGSLVVNGNVGAIANTPELDVINGILYPNDAKPTQIALADLTSAFDMFDQIEGCSYPQSPSPPSADTNDLSNIPLVPGYYCLDGPYVDDDSVLTLEGDGLYVFYVFCDSCDKYIDPKQKGVIGGFELGGSASIVLAGGAKANNVYWIVYDDWLTLDEDSTLVGSVLSLDELYPFNDVGSQVNGRLLTAGELGLDDTTVIVP